MPYRTNATQAEPPPPVRVHWLNRWQLSLTVAAAYFLVGGLPQLIAWAAPPQWWAPVGLVLAACMAVLDWRVYAPMKLQHAREIEESRQWLRGLQKSPTGGYIITASAWAKRPSWWGR